MRYFCCDDRRRRQAVAAHPTLNGIDYLEVAEDQPTLFVHFLKNLDGTLMARQMRISGGERIRDIKATQVEHDPNRPKVLEITLDRGGDFSTYTLRLVGEQDDQGEEDASETDGHGPPAGFDPLMSRVDFSFKVNCPSDLDCEPVARVAALDLDEPEIDYLAKDYASFRRLMLDRLAALVPGWETPSVADHRLALVELLAYVGDYLSYRQDAVATEAYLETARRRVSVRRHARLVDYWMHDGANARTWVQVQVRGAGVVIPEGTRLLTRLPGERSTVLDTRAYETALADQPEVYQTMHEAVLFQAHNKMRFHTWGAQECCLPRGATKATLRGKLEHLKAGDVLILSEQIGPRTGVPADADPQKRHAVRLVKVEYEEDPLGHLLDREQTPPESPSSDPDPLAVTQIEWHGEDALPFPVCISTSSAVDVSMALGNIVLADHGRSVEGEPLGQVPPINRALDRVVAGGGRCEEPDWERTPPRFRPHLRGRPITCAAPYQPYDEGREGSSATQMLQRPQNANLPAVTLTDSNGEEWNPTRDLLNSDEGAEHFVVEIESDGTAYLRFGDDVHGRRPEPGTQFWATYRLGNGLCGNVGARAIAHVVARDDVPGGFTADQIAGVSNPLPAMGGAEPETVEEARQQAPYAFRTQERAVTPDDYARMALRHPEVRQARASLRWTGSWYTVFLAPDRVGSREVDAKFEADLREHLERYRLAGHDVEIVAPRYVSLVVDMHVCVRPGYARSDLRRELRQVFSSGRAPDGRLGLFHPDNLTFGQPVYLSRLYAAAYEVAGVEVVEISEFRRQDQPPEYRKALDDGWLAVGDHEIARLENNPNFPERGLFHLTLEGGR